MYRRPLAAFFLPTPPPDQLPVPDFRRHRDTQVELTPELRHELRRLANKRSVAGQLSGDVDVDWSFVGSMSLQTTVAAAAGKVRSLLRFDDLDGRRFRDEYDMFSARRRAVERLGVLVFLVRRISASEARGFSLAMQPWPVIAIVRSDTPRARVFTLLHEFVHILLGRSALCDDLASEGSQDSPEARAIEAFCNKVAAEALMPASTVRAAARSAGQRGDWSETRLRPMAQTFGVSMEAVLLRLVDLQLASRNDYLAFLRAMQARPLPDDEAAFGEKTHDLVLRTQGPTFVRLVLDAMHSAAITAADVADYLDMNLKHLDALERAVMDLE